MHYFILNQINFSLEHFELNEGKKNRVYDFNSGKFISNINTMKMIYVIIIYIGKMIL